MANQKNICLVTFNRTEGKQYLTIKVDPKIELFFKTDGTKESSTYKSKDGESLEFYTLTNDLRTMMQRYNRTLITHKLVELTDYGAALITNERQVNVSCLRTVGISEGVTLSVEHLILDDQVKEWIDGFSLFVKYVFHNFIDSSEVKAVINLTY